MSSGINHQPVMVREVLAHLLGTPDGAYLDLTAGLGGHLVAMSEAVSPNARLYGLDRDAQAIGIATERLKAVSANVTLHTASYLSVDAIVKEWPDQQFDGILMDLGLSSLQLDDPTRGFSFRFDTPLDMRFDEKEKTPTAADLLNSLTEQELTRIFFEYGEERQARMIAKTIVRERQAEMIQTSNRLKEIIASKVPPQYLNKSLARIFQALRIVVNHELEQLENTLPKLPSLLNLKGRLAILTYHSLEDRLVKRFFQKMAKGCVCSPEFSVCMCGQEAVFKIITRKAMQPTDAEIQNNSRSRSAQLRVAERI